MSQYYEYVSDRHWVLHLSSFHGQGCIKIHAQVLCGTCCVDNLLCNLRPSGTVDLTNDAFIIAIINSSMSSVTHFIRYLANCSGSQGYIKDFMMMSCTSPWVECSSCCPSIAASTSTTTVSFMEEFVSDFGICYFSGLSLKEITECVCYLWQQFQEYPK